MRLAPTADGLPVRPRERLSTKFCHFRGVEYNINIRKPGGCAMSTAEVEIVECTTPQQRDEFIFFQWVPYQGNPYWVPPLISERREFYDKTRHPFHEHADVAMFLAKR